MKRSKYNILQKTTDNKYILYNSFYKNIVELDKEEKEIYDMLQLEEEYGRNEEFINSLYNLNFLIDDGFDELEYFKLQWYRSLFSSGIMRHTIFPNLACNCDCPYCFENKTGSIMTKETADRYLGWLEPQLDNVKHFYLNWFGGEPLLSKDIIEYLSREIVRMQEKYHFEYEASVVTNGVLLDEMFIERLPELKIASIQVTLDGSREFHDKYRFLKGSGEGTFDIILSNLAIYAERNVSDTASTIRVNVTDDNYHSIGKLLDDIPESMRQKFMLLFRWIYSHPQGRNPGMEFASCQKGNAPFENLSKLYQMADGKGFITNTFDEGVNFNFCECDFDNAIQIDPDGDFFVCSHNMEKDEAIGNIWDGFGNQKNLSRYAKFINANPFSDDECLECSILPICKGGCRKARYLGRKVCSDVRYSIPEYILQKAGKQAI